MTPKKRKSGINEQQKEFIVQQLACFSTPQETADAVNEEFGLQVTRQGIERYDPGKRAGRHMAKHWREAFDRCREAFLKHIEEHVPEANKAVRIKQYAHASRAYKGQRNYLGMKEMLQEIAREMGNVHTNRRELTGKGGGPIKTQEMSQEQADRELAILLEEAGLTSVDTGDAAIH